MVWICKNDKLLVPKKPEMQHSTSFGLIFAAFLVLEARKHRNKKRR